MYQCPARCLQRLVAGLIEKIALAGGKEAFDAMACVHFQHVTADHTRRGAPLPNGERSGQDIVGRAEMGADTAALILLTDMIPFGNRLPAPARVPRWEYCLRASSRPA